MAKRKTLAAKIAANRKRAAGTGAGAALELRIDLAQLISRILKVGKGTPRELAKASGLSLPKIKAILSADYNFTLNDVGAIGFALGVDFHLGAQRRG